MARNALVLSLAMFAGFFNPALAADPNPAPISIDAKVEWPDYRSKSKPWTMVQQESLIAEVRVPVKNNKYVIGSGRYDVLVGTVMIFMDSPDIQKSATAVTEAHVLGKGPVLRMMQMRGVGVLSVQLKVNGKWEYVPRGFHVLIEVLDPQRVVFNGELQGVVLKMMDGEVEKLKVVVGNTPADKPKK